MGGVARGGEALKWKCRGKGEAEMGRNRKRKRPRPKQNGRYVKKRGSE